MAQRQKSKNRTAQRLSSPRSTFWPEWARQAMRALVERVWGLLALVGASVLIVALATYHPLDPSWNTATSQEAQNVLGLFGAYMADFMLQIFGLGTGLIIFRLSVRGLHHLCRTGVQPLRLSFVWMLLLQGCFCLYASLWPNPDLWPLSAGLGGVFGDVLAYHVLRIIPFLPSTFAWSLTLPMVLILLTAFWHSFGWSWFIVYKTCAQVSHFIFHLFWGSREVEMLKTVEKSIPVTLKKPFPFEESVASLEEEPPYISHEEEEDVASETRVSNLFSSGTPEEGYVLPPPELIEKPRQQSAQKVVPHETYMSFAQHLGEVLEEFGVRGEIADVLPGPVVTLYELKPAPGIKTSRVVGLADDIARSMSAVSARVAVVPGRNVIGIELPNPSRETVFLRELVQVDAFKETRASLPLILGKDISGAPIVADLSKMPHLLVAGTTGSGKSVAINTMILSLLYRLTPEQCRFIMIDPKMLELSVYDGIPHLLTPVVVDPKKAIVALKWAVKEMENRYRLMSRLGVRSIDGYNERLREAKSSGELLMRRIQTGFDSDSGKPTFENQPLESEALPYIVVVVDEMADLMMVAGKDIEAAVQRLAQMARAAGIHLIMATQRPSVDVITGTIKANFPTRISFQVTSKIDSRTILGEQGAEQLLGQGDMLYMQGGGRIQRVHGAFCKDADVERVVGFLKHQGEPVYIDDVTTDTEDLGSGDSGTEGGDQLYRDAVELIIQEGKASTSFIQRHFQIGYNRAARIMDLMEKQGVVSPANHTGKREIISR